MALLWVFNKSMSYYGKRPLWQWIVVYLVIGGIIYALVYYFVLAKKGGYSYNSNTTTYNYASPATSSATSAPSTQNTVTATADGFVPTTITITAGAAVTWINSSGTAVSINSDPHPTHQLYPLLNVGVVNSGASASITFPTPGTFTYHNHLKPSQTGTIVVK